MTTTADINRENDTSEIVFDQPSCRDFLRIVKAQSHVVGMGNLKRINLEDSGHLQYMNINVKDD